MKIFGIKKYMMDEKLFLNPVRDEVLLNYFK